MVSLRMGLTIITVYGYTLCIMQGDPRLAVF